MESTGTKGYTKKEILNILEGFGISRIAIDTEVTSADTLAAQAVYPLNVFFRLLIYIAGVSYPWQKRFYEKGAGSRIASSVVNSTSGSAFGFFHCISGIKK